jgi:hypothetical protein
LIQLLRTINDCASLTVHCGTGQTAIDVNRGVRLGDTISPKLFTACL